MGQLGDKIAAKYLAQKLVYRWHLGQNTNLTGQKLN